MRKHSLSLYAGVLCVLLIAGIAGVSHLRKALPYEFEIIPIQNGLVVTNTAAWNERDLIVSWAEPDSSARSELVMKGSVNQCAAEGLKAGQTYSIRIRRADLKGRLLYKPFETEAVVLDAAPRYVVLVGASVGKDWDLSSFPDRTGESGYVFGYRGKYKYDKEDLITPLLSAPVKPDTVIIKECAAYFPEDADRIIEKLPEWVDLLRENGVTPVLATCVPVTKKNDEENPGRQEAINKANRFIRTYSAENNVGLLDLAETLRVSEADEHMREDFAQPDGLHLAPGAYSELDAILIPSLTSTDNG